MEAYKSLIVHPSIVVVKNRIFVSSFLELVSGLLSVNKIVAVKICNDCFGFCKK